MRIAKPLLVSLAFALLAGCPCAPPDLTASIPEEGRYDVTIHRDLFGVPHIYGKTDPDVAYGLGYAQCEDDFETVQEMLLSVRGRLATHQRFGGVSNDLIVQAFKVEETVNAKYETEVRPEVRALCEAYADGVNHFAALHREEIYACGVFPTTGKDVIAGFTLRMPFFYMLHKHIRGVFDPNEPIRRETQQADEAIVGSEDRGSNTFAVAPNRSADGHTRLAVNSHQPWTGPVAWYEARLKSEEGWDIIGGTFPGAPVILHGHNRDLGWAHTVNVPDLCDIYELTLNPDNPDQYRFDGEWRDFEKEEVTLRVRLWGPITVGITRELLWSMHGPAVISDEGAFAVRFVGYGEVNQLGQFYAMNRATNFDEFRSAMAMQGFFSMNTGYADKEGNIWYLYNAKFPVRNPGYDWSGIVPGDTPETLWTEYYPFEKLPQVFNPESGFVQNCNSSPWKTTTGPGNPKPADFPEWLGIPDEMTNRGWRALELFGNDESITGEEFYDYKFDQRYSKQSQVGDLWEQAAALPPFDDPLLNEAIEVIRNWDWAAYPDSMGTALIVLTAEPIIRAQMFGNPPPDPLDKLREAATYLKKHHGRLRVPWAHVNRLVRGEVNVGLGGGPDVLNAVYGNRQPDGTLHGHTGDSYILMADWDEDGAVSSESVHVFGSATTRPESPHYADQVPLFVHHKLKPTYLDEEDLMAHLEESYRPGEREE